MRRKSVERLGAQRVHGVLSAAAGGGVVGFVDDQHVEAPRVSRFAGRWEDLAKLAQGPIALEEIERSYEPREMRPGFGVQAAITAQASHQGAIDNAKLQSELVPHFILPFDLEGSR